MGPPVASFTKPKIPCVFFPVVHKPGLYKPPIIEVVPQQEPGQQEQERAVSVAVVEVAELPAEPFSQ